VKIAALVIDLLGFGLLRRPHGQPFTGFWRSADFRLLLMELEMVHAPTLIGLAMVVRCFHPARAECDLYRQRKSAIRA